MFDDEPTGSPASLTAILEATNELGFGMPSDSRAGSLLRTLAAAKPNGSFLELGTGTGISTAWILDGMDRASKLVTVDTDDEVVAVARKNLGGDPRVEFVVGDGGAHLRRLLADGKRFDFVFADAWPGKYTHLDEALQLVCLGGLYIVDDMLPQPNWPDGHSMKVAALLTNLSSRPDFRVTRLKWSSGLVVAVRRRETPA